MLRTVTTHVRASLTNHSLRPISANTNRNRPKFTRWHSFSSLPRPSELRNEPRAVVSSHARRSYSTRKVDSDNAEPSARIDQKCIDAIAHHKSPSPHSPASVKERELLIAFPGTTKDRILSLDRALCQQTRLGQTLLVRPEKSGNLLTAFADLSTAKRVFICVGANTAQGKADIDSPVAAATLAHAIYKAGKVAMIVADQSNCNLVRQLVEILDPEYGGFLKYIPLQAVNGVLVAQMANLLQKYVPDVIVHAGVPGRTGDNLYLNAIGAPVGEFNIALDNMMDLANAIHKPTIAIGYGLHQAGFANCTQPGENQPGEKTTRAELSAGHQVIANNTSLGSLALGEMLAAAYTDSPLCDSSQLMALIEHARKWRDNPDNKIPPVRQKQSLRNPSTGKVVNMPDTRESRKAQRYEESEDSLPHESISGLNYIHRVIHGTPLGWSQDIEETKLHGRTFRFISILDSSAGGRIAAKPFQKFFRARSTEDIKILCISDDLIAPLGKKTDEIRRDFVRKTIRHAALQVTEMIVWQCNTACLEDTRAITKPVEEELRANGIKMNIHCLDLIDTTASAIAQYGGLKPTLLATEATASKDRYPEKIKDCARELSKHPEVTVIGAGSPDPELEGLDWASLVNHLYHLSTDQTVLALLRREIRRYVDKIPLDTTSIWLCCTHFPALLKFIEEAWKERLKEAGIKRMIPIFDPNEFQVEALIDWLRKERPTPQADYSELPPFSVQSTKPVIDLVAEVRQVLGDDVPITRIRLDNDFAHGQTRSPLAKKSVSQARPSDAPYSNQNKTLPQDTSKGVLPEKS